MKKTTFLIVSVVVTILFISSMYVFYARGQKTLDEYKLLEVMESTGATILSREAYFWAKPENGPGSAAIYDTLVLELSEALRLKTGEETSLVNIISNDTLWEIHVNGTSPDGDMVNISGRLINRKDSEKESHLIIDVTGFPDREKAGRTEEAIKKICRKYGLAPEINYCITGYFEGKLDTEGLNDVCRKAFRAAGAEKVDGIKEDNLISLTAYSPDINNYVRVDGSRVNLNIALRYNSYEKRTYIWLATPLIAIEY